VTSPARVLILDQDPDLLTRHSTLLRRRDSEVAAETATTIGEALHRIRRAGFDAVVCRVDSPEEVSFLVRIRNLAPRVPLVAVTSGTNPALDDLARESGANAVQTVDAAAAEPAEKAALRIRRLIQKSRATVKRSREVRSQGRDLVAEHRWIIARNRLFSRQRLEQIQEALATFRPLLVEDSGDQVLLMRRAFERASLPFPLPVMHDGEEAIRYLGGTGAYHDRNKFPLPTLVILDLHLPRKSGFDVIQWVRTRPELARLPVYMLTSSPDDLDQAMALGVSDYFTKPMGFEPLVGVVRAIAARWWFRTEAYAATPRSK